MVFDAVLPAVGAAASAIILAMIAGSSFRTMLAALSLQILLTAGQLASIKAAVGTKVPAQRRIEVDGARADHAHDEHAERFQPALAEADMAS